MFGLAGIDIAVIIAYFAVVIAIGVWASRRIKNQTDYFLAGRKFPAPEGKCNRYGLPK